ncbi:uncharacterized protein LOC143718361 [Siphateles boraxobius]|uniref:uncharacterized protein LOC143718361 n=1 Tax=Siphateles boraxobius TaxID=180520 RepID=UPI0040647692
MKKAYKAALQSLFPNSIHVTCLAHIMNLIGGALRRPFDQRNAFMLCFSQMFYQAGSRKRRYLQYMTKNLPTGRKATMAPNPCATRWNSWFTAVQHHSEHVRLYKEFIEMEVDTCGRSPPQSVERLHEMLQNPDMAQSLQVEIRIMSEKCRRVIQLLDIFLSRRPVTTKVFDYLEDLHMHIVANAQLQYEACAQYFEGLDLTLAIKNHILNKVEQAYNNAEDKLSPAALRASACGVVDLDVFWDGLQERLPVLSVLAKRYKDVIVNSADAERSNSIYKLVLSSRRRSVSNNNLKALVFLYHNQRLTSGASGMVEVQEDFEEDMEDSED